jgi:alpha-tubulin suppressor-like RCC1 family protein
MARRVLLGILAVGVIASVGAVRGAAATTSGAVYGWLDDDSGQLGNGTCCGHSDVFVASKMPAGSTSIAVAAGQSHSLAVTSTGAVYAFGFAGRGQLGDGNTANVDVPVLSSMPAGTQTVAVAAGWDQSLALTSTGAVYAWGYNAFGQLGVGTTKQSDVPLLVHLPAGVIATAIAAGKYHSLAVTSTGAVYAWGYNASGQLGNNSTITSTVPVLVALPTGVKAKAIGAGDSHSLAVADNGSVYAWGANNFGQLGNGTTTESKVPALVQLPTGVLATAVVGGGISPSAKVAGGDYSLARTSTGAVYAWGANGIGQLGNGTKTQSSVPVLVHLPTGAFAAAISAGSNYAKALTSQGAIYYWGTNSNGHNQHLNPALAPVVTGLKAVGIAAGPDAEHVLALFG